MVPIVARSHHDWRHVLLVFKAGHFLFDLYSTAYDHIVAVHVAALFKQDFILGDVWMVLCYSEQLFGHIVSILHEEAESETRAQITRVDPSDRIGAQALSDLL